MAGHIRQRGDGWQLLVYAGDGRYVSRTVRGSRRDAERQLARLVTEVADKKRKPGRGRTVADLFEQFITVAAPGWSPSTAQVDVGRIRRTIIPAIGTLRVDRLDVADLERFYATLRSWGRSPATIQRYHNIVNAAFSQAVRWGWVGVNPARHARRPSVPAPEIVPPDPNTVARILGGADPDLHVFLTVEVSTGARRGQLVALRWSDVDLDGHTVRFVNTAVKGPDGQVIRPLNKTKGRRRTVAIDTHTVLTLSVHRDGMVGRCATFGVPLRPDAFVFSDAPDSLTPWRLDGVSQRFARLRRRTDAEGVRFHDLRHYVATQLIAAGVDPKAVADRLGHSKVSTTLDMYTGKVPERDRQAAELLAEILSATKT